VNTSHENVNEEERRRFGANRGGVIEPVRGRTGSVESRF